MKRDSKKDCHPNAPERLVFLFIENDKNYHRLANKINVNVRYVYQLLRYGKEPPKKTVKGRVARRKLFLDKPYQKKPDFIVQWHHLPTEERHNVIKTYLKYKEISK
jgi:hypothetical protein